MKKLILKLFVLILCVNFLIIGAVYYWFSKPVEKTAEESVLQPEVKKVIEKKVIEEKVVEKQVSKKITDPVTVVIPEAPKKTPEPPIVRKSAVEKAKKPVIRWKGFEFSSVAELKKFPTYQNFIADRERDIKEREEIAKIRDQENLRIIKKYRYMTEPDAAHRESIRRGNELMNR